jgi:signal transduction histidine kinase
MPPRESTTLFPTITPTSVISTVRWGVIILGLLFAAASPHQSAYVFGALLLAHALWRTARPVPPDSGDVLVAVVVEVTLTLTAVAATGWLVSPFVVTLIAPIVKALQTRASLRQKDLQQTLALDQLSRLGEANSLLSELHRVTQTLPVSLDLAETVASTVSRMRELFEPNVIGIFLYDEAGAAWSTAATVGTRLPRVLLGSDLPAPMQHASRLFSAYLAEDLAVQGPGLAPTSSTGIYVALRARDRVVGMLALERVIPGTLRERDRALLDGMAEQIAMAIDNARWFGRLRRIGADEERTRIARDLHDRVGQGLAYLSFELDRISTQAEPKVKADMQTLRTDVRQILGEVRETLSDLRTDVSDNQDLVGTVQRHITRVERRTGMHIVFEHDDNRRLTVPVERELWRIAQEALANAERHSGASEVRIRWTCADDRALLEVSDDGDGMATVFAVKPGSYGLTGMRERADAIGASLEIDSSPGQGTTVRCLLEQR